MAPPLDPAPLREAARICACLNLRRAARTVTRHYDHHLAPSGLRSTQFVLLVAIEAEGRVTLPNLAAAVGVDRSTLTRNLGPLERGGLVERAPGRGGPVPVRLSRKGRRTLLRTIPLWRDAQAAFETRLGPERWQSLLSDLHRVDEAMGPLIPAP